MNEFNPSKIRHPEARAVAQKAVPIITRLEKINANQKESLSRVTGRHVKALQALQDGLDPKSLTNHQDAILAAMDLLDPLRMVTRPGISQERLGAPIGATRADPEPERSGP